MIGRAGVVRSAVALVALVTWAMWTLWAAPRGVPATAQAISVTPTPTDVPLPACDQVNLEALVVALFEDTFDTTGNGGGRPNDALLKNCADGKLKVRGSVQLNRIGGPRVEPVNLAFGYGQCADCQTFAVALQVNLYRQGATYVSPKNAATAVNFQCARCLTAAWALQYSFGVDDPSQLPPRVASLINAMDQQFKFMARDQDQLTLAQAEGQIDALLQQFTDLAANLTDIRDRRAGDDSVAVGSAVPTASPTPSPGVPSSPGASPSPTPETAAGASASPTPILSPSPQSGDSATPAGTATAPPAASLALSSSATPSLPDTPTATPTAAPLLPDPTPTASAP